MQRWQGAGAEPPCRAFAAGRQWCSGGLRGFRPTCSAQVEAFLALGPEDVDPLQWWKLNEKKYRFLAPLAKRFLAQPGSVADVERLWSRAKWLDATHCPSMHTSGAFTQFVSLGENAEGLGMLETTTRRGGAEQAAPQKAAPEIGVEELQRKRARQGSAGSSGDGMVIDGEGVAGVADEAEEGMSI